MLPQIISSGPAPFVIKIPIPAGCTAALNASNVVITCPVTSGPAPLSITSPVVLPAATVGVPYSINIGSLVLPTGGVPPYSYKPVDGFPKWSKLSPLGILTGTPTAACSCILKFLVSDSAGGTVSAQVSSLPISNPGPSSTLLLTIPR